MGGYTGWVYQDQIDGAARCCDFPQNLLLVKAVILVADIY
jgi:hypothetical protein